MNWDNVVAQLWTSQNLWCELGFKAPQMTLVVPVGCFFLFFCFLGGAWTFSANINCYFELFIIRSTLTKAPVLAEEKQPQNMTLIGGVVFVWWWALLCLRQTYLLLSFFFTIFCLPLMFPFVRWGVCRPILPQSPNIWRRWEIVVTWTKPSILARNFCTSFNFVASLLAVVFFLSFQQFLRDAKFPESA